ncbi:MAG: LysM peptidoglycan-binding domain-containing protein [Verrucomicrobiales bacterium]|nr:LysM peptidoglycan-binding domain-containing protein [Verrucomicrobiales bacterium]
MKPNSFIIASGLALACISCSTTEPSGDGSGGYVDPYADYDGGYPSESDYVNVGPNGGAGGYAPANVQPGGGFSGGYSPPPVTSQPAYTPPPSTYNSNPVAGARTYTIKKGDTLYGISKMHGVTVESIMSANSLNSTTIFPGDVVQIP